MSNEARAQLSTELGAQPPQSFGGLTEARAVFLAEALRRERASRASGLGDAAEEALKLVPALARGPVRRILFR